MDPRRDTLVKHILNRDTLLKSLEHSDIVDLFLINVDNFSNYNSTYGYEVGDILLHRVADLIEISKPENMQLYRVSSDEFALLGDGRLSQKRIDEIASSMISFFDQMSIDIDAELSVNVSISMGIATGMGKSLLTNAKEALEELREYSRGSYNIYDENSEFIKKQHENYFWINQLKRAFELEKIEPFFQPRLNNETKKVEKFEALARIIDDGSIVPPIRFLEASKLTGTLSLVTRVMIEHSFRVFSGTNYSVSINITNMDLHLGHLESLLLKYATKYGIKPSNVILEMLEDIESLNSKDTLDQLYSLRSHGFKIAIDDFGSRSSNLSRLLDFSPDFIKIDGSFIKNILSDKKSQTIVESIVFLCKKSGIDVVAEFVHSKEVQDRVLSLGIKYSQGYYIGEPKQTIDNFI
jgi:diguanylate cyclase (GGDEF)-like protein